jgi:hypothetical protein
MSTCDKLVLSVSIPSQITYRVRQYHITDCHVSWTDTQQVNAISLTALFLSVSMLPICLPTEAILYIPPVTHWSLLTAKGLALTILIGAPYLCAKLENKT